MKKKKSFTLPETIISVAVIAISLGYASFFMIQSYWQWSFEQQALQLLKDIEMARALALFKREATRVVFFGEQNFYRVILDQDYPANQYYIERKLNRRTGFMAHFGVSSFYYYDEQGILRTGSINFGSSSSEYGGELRFTFQGTPSSGGHVALYSEALDKALVIIVKPVTGRARIGNVRAYYSK